MSGQTNQFSILHPELPGGTTAAFPVICSSSRRCNGHLPPAGGSNRQKRTGLPGRTALLLVLLALASPLARATVWNPQPAGTTMTEHVYKTGGSDRAVTWAAHEDFVMSVSDAQTWDNWTSVDDAPQVRINLDADPVHLRNEDFVITVRTGLRAGFGDRFQAGLCVVFGNNDLLVWGPHGSTNLRLRRPGGINLEVEYTRSAAFLKIKRCGTRYAAWYSADGRGWTFAAATTITATPLYIGTILKTWTNPRAETVDFKYFELTHLEEPVTHTAGDPDDHNYLENTRYGQTDADALHYIYDLSGIDLPVRLMLRRGSPGAPPPADTKLYAIHGADNYDDVHHSELIFNGLCDTLGGSGMTYHTKNLLLIAPQFPYECLAHPHPYPDRHFSFQTLKGEEDRMLLDLHEDFIRERFPAASAATDEKFYLLGHSGGGQFTHRFLLCHAPKLYRALVSSPFGTTYPTTLYNWEIGLTVADNFREQNPRLQPDVESAYTLPFAVLMGENDNEIDRGQDTILPVGYSRLDNAKKWVRQMRLNSGGVCNIPLYIYPGKGHGFSGDGDKHSVALRYMFGTASDLTDISIWQYSYHLDHQDTETAISPAGITTNRLRHAKFNRFGWPFPKPGTATLRLEFQTGGTCVITDVDGIVQDSVPYTLTLNATEIELTVDGEIYTNPAVLYGKLRLYSISGNFMLEEAPVVTSKFITDRVKGTELYYYQCTGRDHFGPTAGAPVHHLRLNADGTVTNVLTGTEPVITTLRRWLYDNESNMLRFFDPGTFPFVYDDFQAGEWRWGNDSGGNPFLAALRTREGAAVQDMLYSAPLFNQRLFEEWDPVVCDYDSDGVGDISDNCPAADNPGQEDHDGDGWGDPCDPVPLLAPQNVDPDKGAHAGYVWIYWDAVAGAGYYRVYRYTSNVPGSAVAISSWISARGFQDTTLTPGRDYCYWVQAAINADGTGVSPFSDMNTGWAALRTPSGLQATDGSFTAHVALSWAASTGATHYQVWRHTTNVFASASIVAAWQTALTWFDTGATPGTRYYYWVKAAVNSSGTRASSAGGPDNGWRALDCNGNGTPDPVDLSSGTSPDCNDNGIPDECDLAEGTSLDCNGNGVPDDCDLSTYPGFSPPEALAVAGGPCQVVAADLDGDGDTDLVTANQDGDTLAVIIYKGSGLWFSKPALATGDQPCGAVAADLDGDDDLDLVSANQGEGTFTVFFNSGAGNFGTNATWPASPQPRQVVAVDLDGDGDQDLVLPCAGSNKVFIRYNDGDAGFEDSNSITVGNLPVGVAAADFTGDGRPDLAVIHWNTNQAQILQQNAAGGFALLGTFIVGLNPVLNLHASAILAGDWDHDGDQDLAITTSDSGQVWIAVNQGTGAFTSQLPFSAGTAPRGVCSADFNQDGYQDLAVSNRDSDDVSILLNWGNGTFFSGGVYPAGDAPLGVAAASFDGDSLPDLALANAAPGQVNLVYNDTVLPESFDCDGNGIPDECEDDCNGNGLADSCDIANGTSGDCNGNGIPDECDFAGLAPGDVNADGLVNALDLVMAWQILLDRIDTDLYPCLQPDLADFNHSGAIDAADLVTLANLLAGTIPPV